MATILDKLSRSHAIDAARETALSIAAAALIAQRSRAVSRKQPSRDRGHAGCESRDILEQVKTIAQGLGDTFAPFCEVVVHDLTDPKNAILAIHNNLSGRRVGQPATELGLARIADPDYPQIISNYANTFADGRQAKSTSIGIRGPDGTYVAALCLNVDLTLFQAMQNLVGQFTSVEARDGTRESLNPTGLDAIRARIDEFAAQRATTPRALKTDDRRILLRELKDAGCLHVRHASDVIAAHLGVSRATVYASAR